MGFLKLFNKSLGVFTWSVYWFLLINSKKCIRFLFIAFISQNMYVKNLNLILYYMLKLLPLQDLKRS